VQRRSATVSISSRRRRGRLRLVWRRKFGRAKVRVDACLPFESLAESLVLLGGTTIVTRNLRNGKRRSGTIRYCASHRQRRARGTERANKIKLYEFRLQFRAKISTMYFAGRSAKNYIAKIFSLRILKTPGGGKNS